MSEYECPRCHNRTSGWPADLPPPDWCDQCGQFAPGQRLRLLPSLEVPAPTITVPVMQRQQANPLLVRPHRCNACGIQIGLAFNARATEQMHVSPGRGVCRTSIYAVLFNPPCCGAYLEAPLRLAGTSARCPAPACQRPLEIPEDIVHRRPTLPAAPGMAFDCPGCENELHVPLIHKGRAVAGMYVVCGWCAASIEVPASGRRPGR